MKKTVSKTRKTVRILALCVAVVLVPMIAWGFIGAYYPELTVYEIDDENLPDAFDGLRIVQISDLHNAVFGEDNCDLVDLVKEARPDIIALTGDLIDSRHTDIDAALSLVEKLVDIAPCYYVPGNHEAQEVIDYDAFRAQLIDRGVTVLEYDSVDLVCDGQLITLYGTLDPAFYDPGGRKFEEKLTETLECAPGEERNYTVLLSHRPERFEVYVDLGVNLALTGHAHGGQIRLPLVGGLYVPNQGWFPRYDDGVFREGQTSMVVSRGIGNSVFPVRFNNRPEVVLVVIRR